jgi:hypothetical protein
VELVDELQDSVRLLVVASFQHHFELAIQQKRKLNDFLAFSIQNCSFSSNLVEGN